MKTNIRGLLARLNPTCTQLLEAAAGACVSRSHYEVTPDHLLLKLLASHGTDVAAILADPSFDRASLIQRLEQNLERLRSGNTTKPVFSPLLMDWLEEAWLISSLSLNEPELRSGALFLALLGQKEQWLDRNLAEAFDTFSANDLLHDFKKITASSHENVVTTPFRGDKSGARTGGAIAKFCTDFTQKATQGKVDPVFGRDREIYQMIDILSRRRKNNPILVGEAGVGKTAVVEGLALRIVKGDVPDSLKQVGLIGLDMGLLQAGAGVQGEFEQRLKSVIEEVQNSPKPLILFIDEAHTLIGAGGAAGQSDAANLLKPALARGELRTIAATTWSEYKKYFEKDPALARRFQPVKLDEPTVEGAVRILRGLKSLYEAAHGVVIRESAIQAAAEYSSRYITGRQLPDKAVDLLDTSAARVKGMLNAKPTPIDALEREIEALSLEKHGLFRDVLQGGDPAIEREAAIDTQLIALRGRLDSLMIRWTTEKQLASELLRQRNAVMQANESKSYEALPALCEAMDQTQSDLRFIQGDSPLISIDVTPDTVAQVISDWTGIPVGKVLRDEANSIAQLEFHLTQRIKGQDAAVRQVSEGLRAAKVGLKDPDQPLGVFLLVGPSGVGKTETALAVADLLFGGERFLQTINMSEFHESHSISRLIGSPPGYVGYGEGGLLTEAVRQQPYSVVLIDEVEKGHLDVMNLFYQVFDKGNLSDGEGRRVDFKNTVLFLTSNLACDKIQRLWAEGTPTSDQILETIRPILAKHFKPALLARMTVVPYRPLPQSAFQEIVRGRLDRLAAQIQNRHHVALRYSEAAVDALVARCSEADSGARAVDHLVRARVLPRLSQKIIEHMATGTPLASLQLGIQSDGSVGLEETTGVLATSAAGDKVHP